MGKRKKDTIDFDPLGLHLEMESDGDDVKVQAAMNYQQNLIRQIADKIIKQQEQINRIIEFCKGVQNQIETLKQVQQRLLTAKPAEEKKPVKEEKIEDADITEEKSG